MDTTIIFTYMSRLVCVGLIQVNINITDITDSNIYNEITPKWMKITIVQSL